MKKYYCCLQTILLYLLCFLYAKSIAQKQGQAKIDSLFFDLKNYKLICHEPCIKDTNRIKILQTIAWELMTRNPDTAMKLNNETLLLCENINWQKGAGQSYHQIATCYYLKGDYSFALQFYSKALGIWDSLILTNKNQRSILVKKSSTIGNMGHVNIAQGNAPKALECYFEAMKIGETLKDSNLVASNLGSIGSVYHEQGDYLRALDYYSKTLKIFEELRNKSKISIYVGNIGIIYKEQGDYPKAIEYYFKALKINEELQNKNDIGIWLGNIANIYSSLKDYSKALEYNLRSLKINEELGRKSRIARILGNIAIDYSDLKNYTKALEYYSKALKLAEEIGDKIGISEHLGNIGGVYKEQGDYKRALGYYFKALEIDKEIENKKGMAYEFGNIGSLYSVTKKYGEAEKYLQQALAIAEDMRKLDLIRDYQNSLSALYEKTGNHLKALEFYKKASLANDSLFNEQRTKEITRSEMNYEFDKKEAVTKAESDKQIAFADAEKRKAKAETELQKQKALRNLILGGAVIILIISVFGFLFYKRNSEQKQKETTLSLQVSETEMKALRSQMNPHFIFNALQSIQTFLLSHKSDEANEYLLKFSKLMRLVLENSQYSEVPLKEDMQALELYMQLESIRLKYPFTYQFHIDKSVDIENDNIPPLILQPFVENAIWHGLQYKSEPGHINIFISKTANTLYATVEDNGVGRDMSKQVAQPMLLKKQSLGMKLTEERLKVLNEIKKIKAQFNITDLVTNDNKSAGTKVELLLPLA